MSVPPERKVSTWARVVPLIVILAAIIVVVVWQRFSGDRDETVGSVQEPRPAASQEQHSGDPKPPEGLTQAEQRWLEATGSAPEWPEDSMDPVDCAAALADLKALCNRLDARDYIAEWNLGGGTFGLLLGASGELEAHRPVVEGELIKYGSVLQNVSHLFRVLGERRVRRMAQIMVREPDMAEPMAMALYRWSRVRRLCGENQPRGMTFSAQYDYAAYLVSTIGGQAYLRRRAPRLEALASFYSLMILDNAIERGYNPYGIDPRSEISRCLGLVNSGDLVFRDRYSEILKEMDQRWSSRDSMLPAGQRGK